MTSWEGMSRHYIPLLAKIQTLIEAVHAKHVYIT